MHLMGVFDFGESELDEYINSRHKHRLFLCAQIWFEEVAVSFLTLKLHCATLVVLKIPPLSISKQVNVKMSNKTQG